MQKLLVISIVTYFSVILVAGAQGVQKNVDAYFSDFGKQKTNVHALESLSKESDKFDLLRSISRYAKDSNENFRGEAYRLLAGFVEESDPKPVKQFALSVVLQGLDDFQPEVVSNVVSLLKKFKPSYFTSKDISQILKSSRRNGYSGEHLKLLGYIGGENTKDSLKSIQVREVVSANSQWSMSLALARMGDEGSISIVLSRLEKIKTEGSSLILLLPDFGYVKQKKIYDKLIEILLDGSLQCRSMNPSSSNLIPCGYYVISEVAKGIEGFPVEVDEFGELLDDFSVAQQKTRKWLADNKGKYLLKIYNY